MNTTSGKENSKKNKLEDHRNEKTKINNKLDEIIFWGIVFLLVILFAVILCILILVYGLDYLNF